MENENINALVKYMRENKASNYPIVNEALARSADFLKNGYLRILAVIMQQSGNITEDQIFLFQRIITGACAEKTDQDYLRMALDISIDDFVKFVAECRENVLKYRLILDALVIVGVKNVRSTSELELIANFCEFLYVNRNDLEFLVTVARSIIAGDGSNSAALRGRPENIPLYLFKGIMGKPENASKSHRGEGRHENRHENHRKENNLQEHNRQVVVKIGMNNNYKFRWNTRQGNWVNNGEVVAKYKNSKGDRDWHDIVTPVPGIIYQFTLHHTLYGIVSDDTDSKDSIKSWIEKNSN